MSSCAVATAMAIQNTMKEALDLSGQAVHQDKAKNYEEAARCYKESIDRFMTVFSAPTTSDATKEHIHARLAMFKDRLYVLERYLFSKADLTDLFKSACFDDSGNLSNNNRKGSAELVGLDLSQETRHRLQEAEHLLDQAKKMDEARQYRNALERYNKGMSLLMKVASSADVLSGGNEKLSKTLKIRSLYYQERASVIEGHLEDGRPAPQDWKIWNIMVENQAKSSSNYHQSDSPEPLRVIRHHHHNYHHHHCYNHLQQVQHPRRSWTFCSECNDGDCDSERRAFQMDEICSPAESFASFSDEMEYSKNNNRAAKGASQGHLSHGNFGFALSASCDGSRHSLYPSVREIKRGMSHASDFSDFSSPCLAKLGPSAPLASLDHDVFLTKSGSLSGSTTGFNNVGNNLCSSFGCLSTRSFESFNRTPEDVQRQPPRPCGRSPGVDAADAAAAGSDDVRRQQQQPLYANVSMEDVCRRSSGAGVCLGGGRISTSSLPNLLMNSFYERDRNVSIIFASPPCRRHKESLLMMVTDKKGGAGGGDDDYSLDSGISDTSPSKRTNNNEGSSSSSSSNSSSNGCSRSSSSRSNRSRKLPSSSASLISAKAEDEFICNGHHALSPRVEAVGQCQQKIQQLKEDRSKVASNGNTLNRLMRHSTLRRAPAVKADEEELIVLFTEEVVNDDKVNTDFGTLKVRQKSPNSSGNKSPNRRNNGKPSNPGKLAVEELEVYGSRASPSSMPSRANYQSGSKKTPDTGKEAAGPGGPVEQGCYVFLSCLDGFGVL